MSDRHKASTKIHEVVAAALMEEVVVGVGAELVHLKEWVVAVVVAVVVGLAVEGAIHRLGYAEMDVVAGSVWEVADSLGGAQAVHCTAPREQIQEEVCSYENHKHRRWKPFWIALYR